MSEEYAALSRSPERREQSRLPVHGRSAVIIRRANAAIGLVWSAPAVPYRFCRALQPEVGGRGGASVGYTTDISSLSLELGRRFVGSELLH